MDDDLPNLILSVDTSLAQLSVALTTPSAVLGAASLEGRESRNEKVLPTIDWLIRESGADRQSIDLLVVTRGPGSFTGVRIGLATVQGMAMALRRPLLAMSTHEAALGAAAGASSVLVHGDAGRAEVYASGFRDGLEVFAPTLLTAAQFQSLRPEFESALDASLTAVNQNIALLAAHRARHLCAEGLAGRYGHGSPIYVRLAEAEVKRAQRSDG